MPNMSPKKNADALSGPRRPQQKLPGGRPRLHRGAWRVDEAAPLPATARIKPCVSGCPVQVDIPEFIEKVAEEDYRGRLSGHPRAASLPAVCGRVCPQETQCESKCVRGIKGEPVGIGRLERFVADWHNAQRAGGPRQARFQRPQGRRYRLRARRPDLRGRPRQEWAMTSPCSRRFTSPAACWSTASPSSVCPRPSCRRRSTASRHSASRSRRTWSSASVAVHRRAV